MSPWIPRLALALAAIGVVGAIVSISLGEGGPQAIDVSGADETLTFYTALPQDGERLGPADAPVEIDVFADLRSTQSADYHADVVRPLIDGYVRADRAQVNLRHRSVGGSELSLPAVAATIAGEQGRQWQYAELVLRNLDAAGPAGADEEFLGAIADALRGATRDFEAEQLKRELASCADRDEATPCPAAAVPRADDELAAELGLPAQPAVVLTGPGGSETLVDAPPLSEVEAALARIAGGG